MTKEIFVCFGVDVDAVAGWLGSYGGENSGHDISRGVFAAEVGTPRLLKLFKKFGITTTWFIPGHTIESFPKQMQMVVAEGHEIGTHGYSHENPRNLSLEQEEAVLKKCIALIKELWGQPPVGNTAPWWEMSPNTVPLLLKYGFRYDRSMADNDFQPFYARVGRSWTKIDYSKKAEEWMKPMNLGEPVDLVEFSASWYFDDLPPMQFIKSFPNSYGFTNPRDIEEIWREQFDFAYREFDYAVIPLTIHPDVAGRGDVIMMLERFITYMMRHPGVKFAPYKEVAEDFRKRFPFKK